MIGMILWGLLAFYFIVINLDELIEESPIERIWHIFFCIVLAPVLLIMATYEAFVDMLDGGEVP